MRRIVSRLKHVQLPATVAVVVVALLTFGAIAIVGGTHRENLKTSAMLDDLHASVIQIGAVHSSVASTNTVADVQALTVERIRQQITADLRELEPRFDDSIVFEQLESRYLAYIDAVGALVVAAQAGILPERGAAVKANAANALFEHAAAIGEARDYLAAESANAWNVARIGL